MAFAPAHEQPAVERPVHGPIGDPLTRVERMEERDVEAAAALELEVFTGTPDRTHAVAAARLREDLRAPLTRAWVARGEDGETLAYLLALHAADELHVLNVATAPVHRRRGIGSALVDAALAYAALNGVRLLVLEVRRSNRDAIRLYRRVGFAAIGFRRGYYGDGEDALDMHLELDPETGKVVARGDEVTVEA
jgi:ribosomal-protein-alanine N-acetyltransferase